VVDVVDEDPLEKPHRQQAIELLCAGVLLRACQGDEGNVGDFD